MPMLTAVAAILFLAASAASEPAGQAARPPVAQDDAPTTQASPAAGLAPEQVAIPALDGGVIPADLYGQGDRGIVLAPGGSFDKGSWAGQAKLASTTSVPERLQGRKLFIVSRGDIGDGDIPRLPRVRDQFERAPDPKELLILEGPAHAQFLFQTDQGERLMREIVRFLTAP
jgi:hypothetical protein